MGANTTIGRYIVPILLVVLTLGVFAQLRDYGPESTLRRFHEAIGNKDESEIERVTLEGAGDPRVVALTRTLREAMERGVTARILAVQRTPRRALVEVAYFRPTSPSYASFNWVLDKDAGRWKVNASLSGRSILKN